MACIGICVCVRVSAQALVNNLDLRVEHKGITYWGNGGQGPDKLNSVERVSLDFTHTHCIACMQSCTVSTDVSTDWG